MKPLSWSPYALILLAASGIAWAQEEERQPSELEKKLEAQRVTFQFLSTPVKDALAFLSRAGGVSILVAPNTEAETPVTFSARDMTLRRAVRWVTQQGGLDFVVLENHVLVADPDEIARRSVEQAVFDVRDLTMATPDFPGPVLSFTGGDPSAVQFGSVEEAEGAMSIDLLIEFIEESIAPSAWDPPYSIRGERGVIFVKHRPAVIEAVRGLLGELRSHAGRVVSVEGTLYAVPAAVWRELLAEAGGDSPRAVLDATAWSALRESLERAEGVRVLVALSTTGAPAQRVHALSELGRDYLADVDAQVAQGSAAADGIVDRFRGGAVLDVRPTPTSDEKAVTVRLRFETVGGDFDRTAAYGDLRIELPILDGFVVETSVRIPEGGAHLLTLTHPSAGASGESRLVLAVHPRVVRMEEGKR